MLFIAILLVIIAVILLGLLITCMSSYRDTQKHFEWIYNEIFDSRQSLQFMAGKVSDIAKNTESMYHVIADIKFQQENLEKHDLNKAIKTLENIENSLLDLKDIHDTLSSLERSLEIITDHPAFTTQDDDALP